MVKIPGTAQGLPAIRQCLSEGININITLLFSVPRYREVMEAYLSALEERVKQGQPIDKHPVGRELLRLARRHQRRPKLDALTKAGNAEGEGAAGEARDRQRPRGLRGLPGGLRRRALCGAQGQGRRAAAAPLGVDLDEGPGPARPLLRRGARRPELRRHDAARDVHRLPRPRQSEGAHLRRSGGSPRGLRGAWPSSRSTSRSSRRSSRMKA